MDKSQLQRQAAIMRTSLFDGGYLDEQFVQLEELQDDANPNFVEEIVTLFYNDTARLITNIDHALMRSPMDFDKLDDYMHQLRGSSSGIGASKVKTECARFIEYCTARNSEGCIRAFRQAKQEYKALRKKLETYFQLTREAADK